MKAKGPKIFEVVEKQRERRIEPGVVAGSDYKNL
jgi:hypothetical protein